MATLPNEFTVMDYVESLKIDRDTAERRYKQQKSLWETAKAASDKARLTETTWKEYNDKITATDQSAKDIESGLSQSITISNKIGENTAYAQTAVELLYYEVRDISCQAEVLKTALDKFKNTVSADNALTTVKTKIEGCVDAVFKSLEPVTKESVDAIDKVFGQIKVVDQLDAAMHENTGGVNTRLADLLKQFKVCGFPNTVTLVASEVPNPGPPPPLATGNYDTYRNASKTTYMKAKTESVDALAAFNNATIAKNDAEAKFNASNAAYEAAKAAQKC